MKSSYIVEGLCVALISLSTAFQASAQITDITTKTIQWNAKGFRDMVSNSWTDQKCYFKIYPDNKIEWVQGNENVLTTISITGTDGKWKDASLDGSVTYKFNLENTSGKLIVSRSGGIATVTFDLRGLKNGDIINQYTISDITVN